MEKDLISIRRATVDDVDPIWEVEKQSFTTPWSRDALLNELTTNKFAYYFVIEIEKEVVGYAGMWIILDEAHITNVAISPKSRGLKLGELIMRHMMSMASFYGAYHMTLEVRASNEIAQNLYHKLDFKEKGIRKNYYADSMEDALIMWVEL